MEIPKQVNKDALESNNRLNAGKQLRSIMDPQAFSKIFSQTDVSGLDWKVKHDMFSIPLMMNEEDFDFRYLSC